jgi:hypothetical protein
MPRGAGKKRIKAIPAIHRSHRERYAHSNKCWRMQKKIHGEFVSFHFDAPSDGGQSSRLRPAKGHESVLNGVRFGALCPLA